MSGNNPIPMKGGGEYDMLSRKYRRIIIRRPGDAKEYKRSYQRRVRQTVRAELRAERSTARDPA